MSTTHPDDDSPTPAGGQELDVGSWNRFIPSLTHLLQQTGPDDDGAIGVRLTATEPIVTAATAAYARPEGGLRRLLGRRRRLSPSPLPPVLTVRTCPDAVVLTAPLLDDDGRARLGEDALAALDSLGWKRQDDAMVLRVVDAASAAELATRVLIEVFDVAHPADLVAVAEPAAAPEA
ncbi:TY-Chap domain-containing protein [Actinomyces glycerinitolerans]|uniref:TY-Chap N-terminal domain-containing protein n=1 Tax=Actinomyces glycerinitolerans TaxID=1892869 RepID=A0A1M4S078_9ACTO|nr:hypothetical protein [Actinomyces glycerinitolerans]SHE25623.1 Hypothetical protein ACGLYG10_1845 [Actinomyces glycerinitolerans]